MREERFRILSHEGEKCFSNDSQQVLRHNIHSFQFQPMHFRWQNKTLLINLNPLKKLVNIVIKIVFLTIYIILTKLLIKLLRLTISKMFYFYFLISFCWSCILFLCHQSFLQCWWLRYEHHCKCQFFFFFKFWLWRFFVAWILDVLMFCVVWVRFVMIFVCEGQDKMFLCLS